VESILLSLQDYIIFDNPLFVHLYVEDFPYKYFRENHIDYFLCKRDDAQTCFYKKKVLLWHMQSCFNFYLAKFIFRKKFLKFLPLGTLEHNIESKGLEDFINKKLRRFLNHTSRLSVYKYFFEQYDFSGILSDKVWWRKGIFID